MLPAPATGSFLSPVISVYRAIPMLNSAVRLRLDNSQSNAVREMNTDVNKLVVSPITRVAANPFTAGVPKKNRKAHETTVVTCVSTIRLATKHLPRHIPNLTGAVDGILHAKLEARRNPLRPAAQRSLSAEGVTSSAY